MTVLIHQAALGDFVLTWPLLRALPGPITLITSPAKAALAAAQFRVEAVSIDQPALTALHGDDAPGRLPDDWLAWWQRADRIISFVSDGRDQWAANLAALAPQAERLYLATRPPADWRGHVTDWHRHQLREQGLELPQAASPPLQRAPDPAAPVLLHPGSGSGAKCWPAERFEQLIERLDSSARPIQPILGEAELDRWPRDRVDRWRGQFGARCCTNLGELTELMRQAAGYIGNDAGPTHLAAQLGLTTVALFGPTDPHIWQPLGPAVRVLAPVEPGPMTWLSVESVAEACEKNFPLPQHARGR